MVVTVVEAVATAAVVALVVEAGVIAVVCIALKCLISLSVQQEICTDASW